MSKDMNDVMDEAIDALKKIAKKVAQVAELHLKVDSLLEGLEFDVKMSVLSMAMSKAIINESDDSNEAMSYVARLSHSLVEVVDRHIEEAKKAEEDEEDEEDEDNDGPVH